MTPSLYGAHKDVPFDDIAGLINAAKKAPGTILTGGTLGSTSHFVWLLLEDATGIKLKHVSYDGTRQRMTALLGKHIAMGELNVVSGGKYIQNGELKALGITTAKRNASIPNVKTLREQGYDLIFGVDRGVSLPKGSSKAAIDFWAKVFEKAYLTDMVQELVDLGVADGMVFATDVVFLPVHVDDNGNVGLGPQQLADDRAVEKDVRIADDDVSAYRLLGTEQ